MTKGDKTVLVPLLEGFEEIEAVTLVDVLRRGGVRVLVAGDVAGPVRGAHDLEVVADLGLADVAADDLDMVALPGGARASESLAREPRIQALLARVAASGGYTCAVCAAPLALAAARLHENRVVTSHPSFAARMEGAGRYVEDRVVADGKVVTSRSAGTAMEFALTLVGLLRGPDVEKELERSLLVARPSRPRFPGAST